jgi:hypothetical protein
MRRSLKKYMPGKDAEHEYKESGAFMRRGAHPIKGMHSRE